MARRYPVWTDFLDWFEIPDAHKSQKAQKFILDFRKSSVSELAGEVEEFAVRARQLENHRNTIKTPEISQHPAVSVLRKWLVDGDCAVYCEITRDGYVAIAIGQGPQDFAGDDPDRPINRARVIALVVFSLIVHAFEGQDARDLAVAPRDDFDSVKLRVPIDCVWPLQVRFPGTSPYKKRPHKILVSLWNSSLRPDEAVERHHVGWMPLPKQDMPVQELLGRRFDMMSDRIQHRLTHEIPLNPNYGAQTNERVYERIKNWAFYSTVLVVLVWFALVFFSAAQKWLAITVTEGELWVASLSFALIALWRFATTMALSLLLDRSGKLWRPLSGIVNMSFFHPIGFLIAPLLMAILFGWSVWRDVGTDIGMVQARAGAVYSAYLGPDDPPKKSLTAGGTPDTDSDGNANGGSGNERDNSAELADREQPKGYSYGGPLFKWVWTLPILAVGLLVNSYISLRKLVASKNLAERKLMLLGRAEKNLKLSRNYLRQLPIAAEATKDWALLSRVQARIKQAAAGERSRSDREKAQFASQSTFNAAAVALLALLKPLGSLSPEAIEADLFFTDERVASFQSASADNCAFPDGYKEVKVNEPDLIAAFLNARMVDCLHLQGARTRSKADSLASVLNTSVGLVSQDLIADGGLTRGTLDRQTEAVVAKLGLPGGNQPQTYPTWFACPWPDAGNCSWERPRPTWEELPLVQRQLAAVHGELLNVMEALNALKAESDVVVTADTQGLQEGLEAARKLMQQVPQALRVRLELTTDTEALQRDLSALRAWLPLPWLSAVQNLSLTLNMGHGEEGGSVLVSSPFDQVFQECRPLGQFLFETNSSVMDERGDRVGWRLQTRPGDDPASGKLDFGQLVETAWMRTELEPVNAGRIYVMGIADTRGTSALNSDLADRRAQVVSDYLTERLSLGSDVVLADSVATPVAVSAIVPVSTGEFGWMAGLGLPVGADDSWHRTSKLFLCPVEDGARGASATEIAGLENDPYNQRIDAIKQAGGSQ